MNFSSSWQIWICFFLISGAFAQESPHKVIKLECSTCHNLNEWRTIRFDHRTTGFPLTGVHKNVACANCHKPENFWDVEKACISCHLDIHQSKLGNWCQQCHTPRSWTIIDATKAHANTTFPLLGVHARLDCNACHYSEIEGQYSPLESTCYFCHEKDYRTTTAPNHQEAEFSKNCVACHNFYGWQPASFKDHEGFFPIFSGAHAGVWNTCRTCHSDPADYAIFSCFEGCHEHNRSSMDNRHREVRGYQYDSNACYNCHPAGRGGD